MTPAKLFIYRTNLHNIFGKQIDKLFKVLHFMKFAQWVSKNRNLSLNDFPAKGIVYKRRYQVHEFIIREKIKNEAINYLEFGVADGETIFWWLEQNTDPDSRFFGFDTFTGLPEDWGNYKKGTFDLEGKMPAIRDERAQLCKGLFQETLFDFLKTFRNDKKKFILLDADLYSSTLYVLMTMAPYLATGDIIVFDEFSAQEHEFLAYKNFLQAFPGIHLKTLAASNNYGCVAFEVFLKS